jgi:hypothetical protein
MEKKYKKLTETPVLKVNKFIKKFYQAWDQVNNKSLKSDVWQDGYKAKFLFEGDDFLIDLSQDNVNQMLGACLKPDGTSSVLEKSFEVKTNGKTGMEIRYYFNLMKDKPKQVKEITPEEIPF